MEGAPLRVLKLGGSLLDLPALADRLRRWIALQPVATNVIVAGGGAVADAIRKANRIHGLNADAAHWLCIYAMELNARLVAGFLPDAQFREGLDLESVPSLVVLNPWSIVRPNSPTLQNLWPGTLPLDANWSVTSDTIAARAARMYRASELVLLKSALPPSLRLLECADAGYVDPCFREEARWLPRVRCVNLRADPPEEMLVG